MELHVYVPENKKRQKIQIKKLSSWDHQPGRYVMKKERKEEVKVFVSEGVEREEKRRRGSFFLLGRSVSR